MSKFDEIKVMLKEHDENPYLPRMPEYQAIADLIAMVERLRDGLMCVLDWAGNWDSPFMEDDEWTEAAEPKIRALLREVTGEN